MVEKSDLSAMQWHYRLVAGLKGWLSAQSACGRVELIETHISTVILSGIFAYKIKKPLDLGFLDFSTLERRRFCCEEEVRLNRRLAPDVYLDAVSITGTPDFPTIATQGPVIEYAVRMRRFIEGTLLSDRPERLNETLADELAYQLAGFHASIGLQAAIPAYGRPEQVLLPMQQNFDQIRAFSSEFNAKLSPLQAWTLEAYARLEQRLGERRTEGFIRECHGDLHLGNIVVEGGRLILFDGIEFNPGLRWIDTISELAFLLMDIEEKGQFPIAWRVLNSYLKISGDYRGLAVLRFYQLYRAMVRAKVIAIRMHQSDVSGDEMGVLRQEFSVYLDNARRYTCSTSPSLLIAHGLSGSGKSTFCSELMMHLPAVRIQSDVERKRLAGLDALSDSGSSRMEGIYTDEFSRKTYDYLLSLTQSVLQAGYTVIVDAAFLKSSQRRRFSALASEQKLPFIILDFPVPHEELRRRVAARKQLGSDPSEAGVAVLNGQIASVENLTEAERKNSMVVNQNPSEKSDLVNRIQCRLGGR